MRNPGADLRDLSSDVAEFLEIKSKFPIAVSDLWRPFCHRWDGRGVSSPRDTGCGQPMDHIGPGLYQCRSSGCSFEGQREARTSQRESILNATRPGVIAYMVGGANRAGKTEGALQLAVAIAGGRRSWASRSWCKRNNLPISILQDGPGTVWVSALTYADALEYHRPTLDKYLPQGCKRRSWEGQQQGTVNLPGGGSIVSKAAAMGRKNARRRYQGKPCHLIVLDEEHPLSVFEECVARTGDFDGTVLLSMTPLMGLTWPYESFLTNPQEGYFYSTLYGLDNPYVSSVQLRRRFAGLEPHKSDARLYGKWSAAKGLIYPSWNRAQHLIPDRAIPKEWPKYRSIDFGSRFACIWGAIDPSYNRLYIYRVLYTEDRTIGENAREINRLSGVEKYRWTIGDPADRTGIITLNREHKIRCLPARKMVDPGIDHVSVRLQPGIDGVPLLQVLRSALPLALDIERYKRDNEGNIIKENDHLADTLRYLCTYLRLSVGMGAT